jgi:hypothetical protein
VEVEGSSAKEDEEVGGVVNYKKHDTGGEIRTDGDGTRRGGDGVNFAKVVDKKTWNGKGCMEVVNGVVEEGCVKVVTVGDVVVTIRDGKGKVGDGRGVGVDDGKVGNVVRESREDELLVVEKHQPATNKMVRMYRSNGNDLKWARSGV